MLRSIFWSFFGKSRSRGRKRSAGTRRLRCEALEARQVLTAGVTSLGLEAFGLAEAFEVEGDLMTILVSESQQGADLNGDSDTSDLVLHVHDFRTGATTNLGLAATNTFSLQIRVAGDFVAFEVSERDQGFTDLNGDGDASDLVMYVYDARQGVITNLGLDVAYLNIQFEGNLLAFPVSERGGFIGPGNDLNGDGSIDIDDTVLHVYDTTTGVVTNTGYSVSEFDLDGDKIAFSVDESSQGGTDFNGDGDALDQVVHVYDVSAGVTTNLGLAGSALINGDLVAISVPESGQGSTDLNGDGDTLDKVLHVHDLQTAATTNLGLYVDRGFQLDGDLLAFKVWESRQGNQDLNGDGDTGDIVAYVYNARTGETINLGLYVVGFQLDDNRLALTVSESRQGDTDLNGDGDTADSVLHLYDAATGIITNLGYASGNAINFKGGLLAFAVSEPRQGNTDLNGDGDTLDRAVLYVADVRLGTITNLGVAIANGTSRVQIDNSLVAFSVLEADQGHTDFNGDGDAADYVLHVYDARTGVTTNLGYTYFFFHLNQTRLAFALPENAQGNTDLNGDGDTDDRPLYVADLTRLLPDPVFAVERLADEIAELDLQFGIENGLMVKLDGALDKLLSAQPGNNLAAVGKFEAFIHEVEAQSDKSISIEAADQLLAEAEEIVEMLDGRLLDDELLGVLVPNS